MSCRVGILVVPGCVATPAMGLIELFATSNRVAHSISPSREPVFSTQLVSLDGQGVTCSHGYSLTVDGAIDTLPACDILFTPSFSIGRSGEIENHLHTNVPLVTWLKQSAERFPLIATHCSGGLVLAEAGLLNGHRATSSWWLTPYLRHHYPKIEVDSRSILVQSGPYLTGGSTSAYQDLALRLIGQRGGNHLARLVAKYMMIDNQRCSQAPYTILSLVEHSDPLVSRADQWLKKNLQHRLSVEDIAREVEISPRTLIRRFQRSLGQSPQTYLQQLRIEKSKMLLETTVMPLRDIVQRCGYGDESAFRRQFKKHCQLSPREYRRRFNAAGKPANPEAAIGDR